MPYSIPKPEAAALPQATLPCLRAQRVQLTDGDQMEPPWFSRLACPSLQTLHLSLMPFARTIGELCGMVQEGTSHTLTRLSLSWCALESFELGGLFAAAPALTSVSMFHNICRLSYQPDPFLGPVLERVHDGTLLPRLQELYFTTSVLPNWVPVPFFDFLAGRANWVVMPTKISLPLSQSPSPPQVDRTSGYPLRK